MMVRYGPGASAGGPLTSIPSKKVPGQEDSGLGGGSWLLGPCMGLPFSSRALAPL